MERVSLNLGANVHSMPYIVPTNNALRKNEDTNSKKKNTNHYSKLI